MEDVFATEELPNLLPKVHEFVKTELLPLETDHHKRFFPETAKILEAKIHF